MHQKDSKKPQYNTTGKTNRIMDRLQGSLILKFIKASAHQQKFEDTNDNTASQYGTETKTVQATTDTDQTPLEDTGDTETCEPRDRSSSMARSLLATTETEHQVKG